MLTSEDGIEVVVISQNGQIIVCLSNGMNSKAISEDEELFISEHTVRTQRQNIMHKLRVRTSAELVRLASERGLL